VRFFTTDYYDADPDEGVLSRRASLGSA